MRCRIATLHAHGVERRTIAWLEDSHPSTLDRWTARAAVGEELRDRPRSGRPPVFAEDIRLKTIGFYCQASPLPGCNTWSLRWAEAFLKQHPEQLGASISRSSLQRILVKHALRPHRYKYFLEITDPDFFPKMKHLIDLYLDPPPYLFNYDECTCLQAKAPLAPELPPEPHQPRKEEFEYVRNGTTDLMAFLEPKTGEVFGRCTPNHKRGRFIAVFREHVSTQPSGVPLHYIMDNLNTHYHDDLCKAVADLSGVTYSPLKTGPERRLWLQSEDKRIVIHFTPFHGSWLNMIEIWFGILNKKCLRHQAFYSVEALREAILAFIETWNQQFAHPFNWKYTGEGLQQKVIARFNKLLVIESHQMDVKFLTKQLLLMANIVQMAPILGQSREWRTLQKSVPEKSNYIRRIIDDDPKERRRAKANQALIQLQQVLN